MNHKLKASAVISLLTLVSAGRVVAQILAGPPDIYRIYHLEHATAPSGEVRTFSVNGTTYYEGVYRLGFAGQYLFDITPGYRHGFSGSEDQRILAETPLAWGFCSENSFLTVPPLARENPVRPVDSNWHAPYCDVAGFISKPTFLAILQQEDRIAVLERKVRNLETHIGTVP